MGKYLLLPNLILRKNLFIAAAIQNLKSILTSDHWKTFRMFLSSTAFNPLGTFSEIPRWNPAFTFPFAPKESCSWTCRRFFTITRRIWMVSFLLFLQRFILLDNPSKQYSVIVSDLPAANGVIHIIDQPIMDMLLERTLRDEKVRTNIFFLNLLSQQFRGKLNFFFLFKFIGKKVGEILREDENYNRFLSLVDVSIFSRWLWQHQQQSLHPQQTPLVCYFHSIVWQEASEEKSTLCLNKRPTIRGGCRSYLHWSFPHFLYWYFFRIIYVQTDK